MPRRRGRAIVNVTVMNSQNSSSDSELMPHPDTAYRLIDFGGGAKLERFGPVLVRRPSPVATGSRDRSAPWEQADLVFQGQGQDGRWTGRSPHDDWVVEAASVRLSLKPTPFGHLGIFPEQIQNWNWIQSLPGDLSGLEALNLFAYTGGTTMALARRGARVTHVDSARPVVRWARKNVELNGLADAPVRWIVEDAMRYVERELRRGRHYDIVVADPPAFGHGPRKRGWEFHRDLPELLLRMGDLTGARPTAVLITGHTPGVDDRTLAEMVADAFAGVSQAAIDHGPMQIRSASGRVFPAGYFARYCSSN